MNSLRIGQVSDLHLEMTTEQAIIEQLERLQGVDLLVNCGDNSSRPPGWVATCRVHRLIAQVLPGTTCLAVLGNHDRWAADNDLAGWCRNLDHIVETFAELGVVFLDRQVGPWRDPRFPGLAIVGNSGWYSGHAPVKDYRFLPLALEGDTRRSLERASRDRLLDQLLYLLPTDVARVCCTHFPIHPAPGPIPTFDWDYDLGRHLIDLGFRWFLEGHSHVRREGPVYQCGSQYGRPSSQIIEIDIPGG